MKTEENPETETYLCINSLLIMLHIINTDYWEKKRHSVNGIRKIGDKGN